MLMMMLIMMMMVVVDDDDDVVDDDVVDDDDVDDDDVDYNKITMTLTSLLDSLWFLTCLHCVIVDVAALLLTDWMITQTHSRTKFLLNEFVRN
jgi:hypothetical protein